VIGELVQGSALDIGHRAFAYAFGFSIDGERPFALEHIVHMPPGMPVLGRVPTWFHSEDAHITIAPAVLRSDGDLLLHATDAFALELDRFYLAFVSYHG
jgi:hypothetical protein